MSRHLLLITAVISFLCGPAMAQEGRRFGRGGGAFLVTQAAVQEELKLSEQQKTDLTALATDLRAKFEAIRQEQLDDQQRRERFGQIGTESRAKVQALLNADQNKRLTQIELQSGARFGLARTLLSREALVKELVITDDQKAQLQQAADESGQAMRDIFGQVREGTLDRSAADEQVKQLQANEQTRVQGILGVPQKEAWQKMQGEPFDFTKLTPPGGNQ